MIKRIIIGIMFFILYNIVVEAQTVKENNDQQINNYNSIENFEFSNPSDFYDVDLFDRSDLRLYTTRNAFEGEYALKMVYKLLSDNMWGSKVVAIRKFAAPVNVGDFKKGSLMVRGDGAQNVLRIQVVDVDGEVYTYETSSAFQNANWHEVVFTRTQFVLEDDVVKKDRKLGSQIQEIRFIIANPYTDSREGTVYMDKLKLYSSHQSFQKRTKQKSVTLKSSENLFRGTAIDVEYRDINKYRTTGTAFYDPLFTQGDTLMMWYSLNTEYRYKYFLVHGDIGFKGRDFGYANSRWGRYDLYGQNLQLTVDTSPFIRYTETFSVGQVVPNFNKWVFFSDKEYWWEGVELTGKLSETLGYDKTGYNLFYLKGWNDSYTVGLKKWYNLAGFEITGSGVLSADNALITNVNNEYAFKSKTVMQDNVGMIEVVKGFNNLTTSGGFAVVWMEYGRHYYRRYGKVYQKIYERYPDSSRDGVYQDRNIAEVSNEYKIIGDETDLGALTYKHDEDGNPIYEPLDHPVKHESDYYRVRLRLKDIPFRYMEENIEYRKAGPYFKPKYLKRQRVDSDVERISYSMLINLNPWSTYKNWQFGLEGALGDSTLPKTDQYYFNNMKNVVWSIGKHIGMVGLSFKQSHIWWQWPNSGDDRDNAYDLYNWVILSVKFSHRILANATFLDHRKREYEDEKTDINYYIYTYRFNFLVYLLKNALFEAEYKMTNPTNPAGWIRNEWEPSNMLKVGLHVDFKF